METELTDKNCNAYRVQKNYSYTHNALKESLIKINVIRNRYLIPSLEFSRTQHTRTVVSRFIYCEKNSCWVRLVIWKILCKIDYEQELIIYFIRKVFLKYKAINWKTVTENAFNMSVLQKPDIKFFILYCVLEFLLLVNYTWLNN